MHEEVFVFPMSFAQQRLWFLYRMQPKSPAYNIPVVLHLRGPLEIPSLKHTLGEIVRRHEILRTVFATSDGEPVQVIGAESRRPCPVIDLRGVPLPSRDRELGALARREAGRPFDLFRGPVIRTALTVLDDHHHALLLTVHHIAFDGWSTRILVSELGALYEEFARGCPSPLPELEMQYADFAHWQQDWLSGDILRRELDHWQRKLAGAPPLLELPTDHPRPPIQSFEGGLCPFEIPARVATDLRELARDRKTTVFMVILAAFNVLLYRYTGQDDLVVGTPVANRNRVEIEGLIGFFVNTLILRTRMDGGRLDFLELLSHVREVALDAFAHQDVPFEKLVEELQPERNLSHAPLLQVSVSVQNASQQGVEVAGLKMEPEAVDSRTAKMDLNLDVVVRGAGMSGTLGYRTDLFTPATIQRMVDHFLVLLLAIVDQSRRPVATLPLLSEAHRRHLLVQLNDTPGRFDKNVDTGSVDQSILTAAGQCPEAVALEHGGSTFTYRQLDRRSKALARQLVAAGVKVEDRVGVLLGPVPGLVEALLAVWRAGGAYVPLSPLWPEKRIATVLEDANVGTILTTSDAAAPWSQRGYQLIAVDGESEAAAAADELPVASPPTRLAYVMYTSGSTGKPKGVMVSHQALAQYLSWCLEKYPVAGGRRVPVHSSPTFDLTVTSLFSPLLTGGRVVLVPEADGLTGLTQVLQEPGNFSLLKITPAHLKLLNHTLERKDLAGKIEVLILGGEALYGDVLKRWRRHAPQTRLINEYGPTEAVVGCCVYEERRPVGAVDAGMDAPVPIGRAIRGMRMYALDRSGQPVPVGAIGELYVGGEGLARGYLGSPAKTAASWLPDPFGEEGGRLYRTGDLGRWRPAEEVLEFLGRNDHQVKLRGYRVELEEVEAVLKAHPEVDEAIVELRTVAGEPGLTAYLVAVNGDTPDVGDVRESLRESLPAFMVPSWFVVLEALPLNTHGKVDRRRLPDPEGTRIDVGGSGAAPGTEIEQRIAEVWRELLGLETVGLEDNFFDLGGHSMLLLRAQRQLENSIGREISLIDLFRFPSIGTLARHLDDEEEGEVSLDKVQQRAARQRRSAARNRRRQLSRERG